MKTYEEAMNELQEQQTAAQKDIRWNYLFIGAYTILIIVFSVWGFRFYKEIPVPDRSDFFLFLCLPVTGLIVEAVSLKKNRDRLSILRLRQRDLILKFGPDSAWHYEKTIDDLISKWAEADKKSTVLSIEQRKLIGRLMPILFSVFLVFVQHKLRDMNHNDGLKSFLPSSSTSEEPAIPVLPLSTDAYRFDDVERHRADSSSDKRISDVPEHTATTDWMNGLTIPAQILYEDSQFTYEVTGCKVKRNYVVIKTRFINHSEYCIKVENASDHDRVNRVDMNGFYVSMDIPPGGTAEDDILVYGYDVPWYDASLRDLELILEVYNADEADSESEQMLLLETPPLIIRTEPAEGMAAQEDILPDSEIKVLYESDEVRVICTGIFDCLFIRDGKPTFLSDTYWEILIENMSQEDVEIKGVVCTVNGRNALWDTDDPEKVWGTVPAGKRETVEIDLIGGMPDEDTRKSVTSYTELVGVLRMPLEDIETSSLSFDLNYTNASGIPVSVRLDESYTCYGETDSEEGQEEALDITASSVSDD